MIKLLFCLYMLSLYACSTAPTYRKGIFGMYEIDKWLIRDSSSKVITYPLLLLKPDSTFELRTYENKPGIFKGTWRTTKTENPLAMIVDFYFKDKKIRTELGGSNFDFHYPNDFYEGKYQVIIYYRDEYYSTRNGVYPERVRHIRE